MENTGFRSKILRVSAVAAATTAYATSGTAVCLLAAAYNCPASFTERFTGVAFISHRTLSICIAVRGTEQHDLSQLEQDGLRDLYGARADTAAQHVDRDDG